MRVLFVSDVYFPRVNGVSTSIRTFRADLAQAGVETELVAPEYPGAPPDHEPGILRVPSAACLVIRKTADFSAGRCGGS